MGKVSLEEELMTMRLAEPSHNPRIFFAPLSVKLHYFKTFINTGSSYQLALNIVLNAPSKWLELRKMIRWKWIQTSGIRKWSYLDLLILRLDPVWQMISTFAKRWTHPAFQEMGPEALWKK